MTDDHYEKLAHMAQQIADYFENYPADQAPASIAEHINQFWSRKMREDFCAHYDLTPEALKPALRQALPLIKRAPEPASAGHSTHRG